MSDSSTEMKQSKYYDGIKIHTRSTVRNDFTCPIHPKLMPMALSPQATSR